MELEAKISDLKEGSLTKGLIRASIWLFILTGGLGIGCYLLHKANVGKHQLPPCRIITLYDADAKPVKVWITESAGHKEGTNFVFTVNGTTNRIPKPYLISDEPYTNSTQPKNK